MASICYWLGVGFIWFLLLAPVSMVLKKTKASQGALSGRNWAIQGIGISTFAIVMMSAIIYLGGKYAWGCW